MPIRHSPEIRRLAEGILEASDPNFSLRVEFEDLLKAVHERLLMIDKLEKWKSRRRRRSQGIHVEVAGDWASSPEAIYATGFSEYLAGRVLQKTAFRIAELRHLRDEELKESEIVRFRREFLNDQLLSREAAHAFSNSPLLALCSLQEIHHEGIPITGHQADVLSTEEGRTGKGRFMRFHFHVKWQDEAKDVSMIHEAELWPPLKQVLEFPPDFQRHFPKEPDSSTYARETSTLRAREIDVLPSSVLGNLKQVCQIVTQFFPWTEAQTAWFALTGMAPEVPPLHVSLMMRGNPDYRYEQVTIMVQPWVSGKTVLRALTHLQREIYGDLPDKKLLGEKVMRVFTFVNQLRHSTPRMKWKEMHQAWGRKYPVDVYSSAANFREAYDRALQSLTRSRLVPVTIHSTLHGRERTGRKNAVEKV